MTTQYANNYSQVRTPPYLEIQSYRILNYHVTQLANQDIYRVMRSDDGELGPLPSRPPLILISKGEAVCRSRPAPPASTDTPLHL